MKYNWNSFPKYIIDCGKLSEPYDLCKIFKQYKIDKYVYEFVFDNAIKIKTGMSAAKSRSRILGERVYRQLAHAYSWGDHLRIDGSSGSDWLVIERDFEHDYGIKLDHRKLTLVIWDVTNYNFKSCQPFKEVEDMESERIDEHIKLTGRKPIGNINDEANKRNRYYVPKQLVENLLGWS